MGKCLCLVVEQMVSEIIALSMLILLLLLYYYFQYHHYIIIIIIISLGLSFIHIIQVILVRILSWIH
jgi:hypothetical protein